MAYSTFNHYTGPCITQSSWYVMAKIRNRQKLGKYGSTDWAWRVFPPYCSQQKSWAGTDILGQKDMQVCHVSRVTQVEVEIYNLQVIAFTYIERWVCELDCEPINVCRAHQWVYPLECVPVSSKMSTAPGERIKNQEKPKSSTSNVISKLKGAWS